MNKFEETGSVFGRRKGNSGKQRTSRPEDIIEEVMQIIEETPKMSVRTVLCNITNKTSVSTRMFKDVLKLKSYKVQGMQYLKESDIISRMVFFNWSILNPAAISAAWFTDEAHFHLKADVNKPNLCVWSSINPTSTRRSRCTVPK